MNKLFGTLVALGLVLGFGCGDDGMPGVDSGPVIDIDGGIDGGETPMDDAGVDAGDQGPNCGDFGRACDFTTSNPPQGNCRLSDFCQPDLSFDLNSEDDPIRDLPEGQVTLVTFFAGGLCTPDAYAGSGTDWQTSLGLCENDSDTCIDDACGTCVNFFSGDAMCLPSCEPSLDGRGDCREGWSCDRGLEICIPGCTSDADCRVTREESNGVEGIQSSFTCEDDPTACCPEGDENCCTEMDCCEGSENEDCYWGGTNFDIQIWDTDPTAPVCNLDTGLCQHENPEGAGVGEPCERDRDCATGMECYEETDSGAFQGGICVIERCDLEGIDCPEGTVCQERGFGSPTCLPPCTFADGADFDDESTWLGALGDCREGYSCFWNGQDPATENNGACLPGGPNDVTEPNVGGACETDDDCWSPFGLGNCIAQSEDDEGNPTGDFLGGLCSVFDCRAPVPGAPPGASWCPDGSICVTGLDPDDPTYGICMDTCATGNDCRDNFSCLGLGANSVCWSFGCENNDGCPGDQVCNIAPGDQVGECRDAS